MSAHTPGPWEWVEILDDSEWDERGPYLRNVDLGKASDDFYRMRASKGHDQAPPNDRVLEAWGFDRWGITVSEADKSLIAAAPDLLEAVRGIHAALNRTFTTYNGDTSYADTGEFDDELALIDAAIARAEETP